MRNIFLTIVGLEQYIPSADYFCKPFQKSRWIDIETQNVISRVVMNS